jgi:hypothetical protein
LAEDDSTKVIVLLRSAEAFDDSETGLRRVEGLAQAFVKRSSSRGFTATGALSHFPIVFGEIRGRDL